MTELFDGPPAIHRWPDETWAAGYVAQVREAGWGTRPVTTTLRWDKRGFLAACRTAFGFPDWFGMNWDALADSLSDVPVPTTGLVVPWRGWGAMARMYPPDFATAVDILGDWVTGQPAGRTVLVSLVGSGPDVAVS
ncbi:MAG: barstar family protein [Candidatus Nanopelagicales bacterium]